MFQLVFDQYAGSTTYTDIGLGFWRCSCAQDDVMISDGELITDPSTTTDNHLEHEDVSTGFGTYSYDQICDFRASLCTDTCHTN
jgi:hypothetical protein